MCILDSRTHPPEASILYTHCTMHISVPPILYRNITYSPFVSSNHAYSMYRFISRLISAERYRFYVTRGYILLVLTADRP